MGNIKELADKFKYNSMQYIEPEDITNEVICINSDKCLFIYQKANVEKELYWTSKSEDNIHLYWASSSKEDFFEGLVRTISYIKQNELKTERIYIEFIPEEFFEKMNELGFKVVSEWVDFWNKDLNLLDLRQTGTINIRPLEKEEIPIASDITIKCTGCSRGFTGQSDDVIREWSETENSYLFVAELDNIIVGMCYVILYGFDSENGTVLWIRELTVDPKYQARGIGRELISHGINWGIRKGAKRSFLACDAENLNAIKLYESLNYRRSDERGQINMEFVLDR